MPLVPIAPCPGGADGRGRGPRDQPWARLLIEIATRNEIKKETQKTS